MAKAYLSHGSMKYHVKEILMKAMMCRFLTVTAQNKEDQLPHLQDALRRYEDMDLNLAGTREAELMEKVLEAAVEDGV